MQIFFHCYILPYKEGANVMKKVKSEKSKVKKVLRMIVSGLWRINYSFLQLLTLRSSVTSA